MENLQDERGRGLTPEERDQLLSGRQESSLARTQASLVVFLILLLLSVLILIAASAFPSG